MTTLIVPPPDRKPWPSLGGPICDMIRDGLVHGPGDLLGEPARLDEETEWWIWRAYEVYPKDHPQAGRRRFKRVALSLRKGTAKTEKAAWIAAIEAHPEGPVRCNGWRRVGGGWVPVGAPVRDPYIPMVAYTKDQSETLAYGALKAILERSPLGEAFDIGEERIKRIDGDGEVVPLASAPSSRDGARTSFEHFDETSHFDEARLVDAHHTMILNLPKRKAADAWALETSVAPVPGSGSVAEGTMDYATQVASGAIKDSRLFFLHRQASAELYSKDELSPVELTAAILEASGPYADYADLPSIAALWQDPEQDKGMLAQRWLNMRRRSTKQAFDLVAWKRTVDPRHVVPAGAAIAVGFDGSRTGDSTGLIGTEIATGFQWPLVDAEGEGGIWYPEQPSGEVDVEKVEIALDDTFRVFNVVRAYFDPWLWETYLARWAVKYGAERVIWFWTNQHLRMARACMNYGNAIARGEVPHSADPLFTAHIGAAHRRYLNERDEKGDRLWVIQKERADSDNKIDGATAGGLSWQARTDAIAAGAGAPAQPWAYERHGVQYINR